MDTQHRSPEAHPEGETTDIVDLPPLTFFFPYEREIVSGVSVLFARLAGYLAEKYLIDIRVVDYPEGYMTRVLHSNERVTVIPFRDGVSCTVPTETVLVLQSTLPFRIPPELVVDENVRVIFWTCHQMNLIPALFPRSWFGYLQVRNVWFQRVLLKTVLWSVTRQLRELVEELARKQSIIFADAPNYRHTFEALGASIQSPAIVPMPAGADEEPRNKKLGRGRPVPHVVSFGWVGRLADFKIHILLYTINKLSKCASATSQSITLHIIGTGDLKGAIRDAKLEAEHDLFHIIDVGVLWGEALEEYLLDNVDAVMAMGMAAKDAGILGLPVVNLDFSYVRIPRSQDYLYKWLFASDGITGGDFIRPENFEQGNRTLDRIVEAVANDYEMLSCRTFAFCVENHSISSVSEKFLAAVRTARMRWGDIDPRLMRRRLVRRAYRKTRRLLGL